LIQILSSFVVKFLELSVVGKCVQPVLTKKEKEQLREKEELHSLAILRDNGLVQKPIVMEQKYALFEIVEEKLLAKKSEDQQRLLPPIRLLQREKTKPVLTAQDLEEKLEKANQRKQVTLISF
jgi:hypothetical protein